MPDCCGLVEIDGQIITARNLADAVSAIMQRLDQDHCVTGFELGVEAQQGSGTMAINSLSFDWG